VERSQLQQESNKNKDSAHLQTVFCLTGWVVKANPWLRGAGRSEGCSAELTPAPTALEARRSPPALGAAPCLPALAFFPPLPSHLESLPLSWYKLTQSRCLAVQTQAEHLLKSHGGRLAQHPLFQPRPQLSV